MILITDGCLNIPPKMESDFKEWKVKEKVKLITMIIGERQGGDLTRVSDRLHLVDSLSIDTEAVGEAVSV